MKRYLALFEYLWLSEIRHRRWRSRPLTNGTCSTARRGRQNQKDHAVLARAVRSGKVKAVFAADR